MRHRPPHRLVFILPASLSFAVSGGVQHPCLHGCLVTVAAGGLVNITGPSRQRCFEQCGLFLRTIGKDHPPASIAATLITPAFYSFAPGKRDSWTIIINSDVTFAPTGLGADLPAA